MTTEKYITNYINKRYHSDEEFRKRFIQHILKYQKTPKGKIARKKPMKITKIITNNIHPTRGPWQERKASAQDASNARQKRAGCSAMHAL